VRSLTILQVAKTAKSRVVIRKIDDRTVEKNAGAALFARRPHDFSLPFTSRPHSILSRQSCL
jgi:hypothetical protein